MTAVAAAAGAGLGPRVEAVEVDAYAVPTSAPEADGTFEWSATTIVVVHVVAGGRTGLGYTYGHRAIVDLIRTTLAPVLRGSDAFDIPSVGAAMGRSLRNIGRPGIGAMAMSALDTALWDLKARLLELPLATLLGRAREAVPVYGSGGFTTMGPRAVADQLSEWTHAGIAAVKMKIGRSRADDLARMAAARDAIGPSVDLMVDANGAYGPKEALSMAAHLADLGIDWYEEPVSSDDLDGLRIVRQLAPPPIRVAAGEYGWDLTDFRSMLQSGAVDVLQADMTRCGGLSGFLRVAALCQASHVPLSAHCAPALHVAAGLAAEPVVHLEYFHDHVRIEGMLFDGVPRPIDGALRDDRGRTGHGLALRRHAAEQYALA